MNHLADSHLLGFRAFGFPTRRKPVRLSWRVTVDFLESHALQAPRCSRAKIALIVGAVNDYRLILAESLGGGGRQGLQWHVECFRQMFFFVVRGRQDFDKLGAALRHQCFHVLTTNFDWHRQSSSKF